MSEKTTLTAKDILAGEVNIKSVTAAQLADFIEEQQLDVEPGATKADTLAAIAEALGADADDPDEDDPDDDADPTAGETAVEGSAFLKRRAAKINAGRDELGRIGSNMADEAKKSSFIARRLRK
jgi:hypothetical protein